jgi:hypothetical protein
MALAEKLSARRSADSARPLMSLKELARRSRSDDNRDDRGKRRSGAVHVELLHLYLLAQLNAYVSAHLVVNRHLSEKRERGLPTSTHCFPAG